VGFIEQAQLIGVWVCPKERIDRLSVWEIQG
jgi:hypothetical protein